MKPKLLARGSEVWPSLGQLGGAHRNHVHLCLADDEPEILDEPADLVLNIPLDLDEQSSADKKGFDCVAIGGPAIATRLSSSSCWTPDKADAEDEHADGQHHRSDIGEIDEPVRGRGIGLQHGKGQASRDKSSGAA